MDWAENELQEATRELASRVYETSEDPWTDLMEAGLLELDGMLELASLLVEHGRAGARIPLFETLVLGWPARASGLVQPHEVLTGALVEPAQRDPRAARAECRDGRLFGEKIGVPRTDVAGTMVVAVSDGVCMVRLADCEVEPGIATHGDVASRVVMDGVLCTRLGDRAMLESWCARVDVGICALLLGLSQEALRLTAAYVSERKQFGRPVGSFQAVQQRAADAWIALQAMEVTMWQAAWRVSEETDSARARAIGRYWAAEGAHAVTAAAQHLHGGFGFDRDYPLHRYFLAVKQHEFLLGGANAQLERLGAMLAERP